MFSSCSHSLHAASQLHVSIEGWCGSPTRIFLPLQHPARRNEHLIASASCSLVGLLCAGFYAGYVASSFTLGRFLSGYFWGHVSDSAGRKPVIIVGLAATAVLSLSFGFSTNYYLAISSRCNSRAHRNFKSSNDPFHGLSPRKAVSSAVRCAWLGSNLVSRATLSSFSSSAGRFLRISKLENQRRGLSLKRVRWPRRCRPLGAGVRCSFIRAFVRLFPPCLHFVFVAA